MLNANSAIFQLYHGENKLIFKEIERDIYRQIIIRIYSCHNVYLFFYWEEVFVSLFLLLFLVKICIFMHIFGTFEGTTLTHRGKRQCFFFLNSVSKLYNETQ